MNPRCLLIWGDHCWWQTLTDPPLCLRTPGRESFSWMLFLKIQLPMLGISDLNLFCAFWVPNSCSSVSGNLVAEYRSSTTHLTKWLRGLQNAWTLNMPCCREIINLGNLWLTMPRSLTLYFLRVPLKFLPLVGWQIPVSDVGHTGLIICRVPSTVTTEDVQEWSACEIIGESSVLQYPQN